MFDPISHPMDGIKVQVFPHAKAEALSSSSAAAMNIGLRLKRRDAADDGSGLPGLGFNKVQ